MLRWVKFVAILGQMLPVSWRLDRPGWKGPNKKPPGNGYEVSVLKESSSFMVRVEACEYTYIIEAYSYDG